MMQSPKTTAAGLCIVISSLALLVAHWFQGMLSMADVQNVVTAVMGLGLIAAKDDK